MHFWIEKHLKNHDFHGESTYFRAYGWYFLFFLVSLSLFLSLFFSFFLFFLRGFCYRVCLLTRKKERDWETESEKSSPGGDGHATIPSPPFSSWDLGHACTCTLCEFKSLGLGLEPWSTPWEFSDIAVMPSADPLFFILCLSSLFF